MIKTVDDILYLSSSLNIYEGGILGSDVACIINYADRHLLYTCIFGKVNKNGKQNCNAIRPEDLLQ